VEFCVHGIRQCVTCVVDGMPLQSTVVTLYTAWFILFPHIVLQVFGMISHRKQRVFPLTALTGSYSGRRAVFSLRYELNFILYNIEVQA
jgi:hypothetical protein